MQEAQQELRPPENQNERQEQKTADFVRGSWLVRCDQARFGPPAHHLRPRGKNKKTAYFVRGSSIQGNKDAVGGRNVRRSHAKMRKTLEPRARWASMRFENRFRSVACRRTRQRFRPRAVAERALRRNPRPTGLSYVLPGPAPEPIDKTVSLLQRSTADVKTPAVLLTMSKCYLGRESNPLLPDYQSGAQPLSCH
jgi:hypothetical protein